MYTLNYFYKFNDKTPNTSSANVATTTSCSTHEKEKLSAGSRSVYKISSKMSSSSAKKDKHQASILKSELVEHGSSNSKKHDDSVSGSSSSASSFLMISNSLKSVRARLSHGIFKSKNNRVSKIRPEHQLALSKGLQYSKKAAIEYRASTGVNRSDSMSSSASSRKDFSKLESLIESKYESDESDDYVNNSVMDELNETNQTNFNPNDTKSFMLTNNSTINDIDMTINTLEMNISSTGSAHSSHEDVEKLCSNSVINLSNDEHIYDTSLSDHLSHPAYSTTSSSSNDSSLLSGLDRQPYRMSIIYRSVEDNKANRCSHPSCRSPEDYDYVQIESPVRSCSDMNLASTGKNLERKLNKSAKALKKQYSETLKYPERKFLNLNECNSNLVVKPLDFSKSQASNQEFSLNNNFIWKMTSRVLKNLIHQKNVSADKSTSSSASSTSSCASSSSAQSQSSASMSDGASHSSYDTNTLFDKTETKHNYAYDKIPLYQSYDELASKTDVTSKRAGSCIELFSYSLWSKLPGVIESGYLEKMSRKEIEIQERWFEIFTSELSYYKTLIILNDIIINECKPILKPYDLNLVFNRHLPSIISMSEKLIDLLQHKLEHSLLISNLFDILEEIMYQDKFELYVSYASEQVSQKEHFDRLMKTNKKFNELVNKLLFDPRLQGKDMCSFLISPIQRLPRYKLLIDAVLKILPAKDVKIIEQGVKLSKNLERLLKSANEKVTKYINFAETIKLQVLLKYDSKDMIILDLVSTKRQLVFHSDLVSFVPATVHKTNSTGSSSTLRPALSKQASLDSHNRKKKGDSHHGCSNSTNKQTYHLILFTDLLLITVKETVDKSFHYRVIEIVNDRANLSAELAELKLQTGDQHMVLSSSECSHISQISNQQQSSTSEAQVVLLNGSSHTLGSSTSTTSSTALALCSTNLAHGSPCSYVLSINIKGQEVNNNQPVKNSKYSFLCTRLEGENWIKHINNHSK